MRIISSQGRDGLARVHVAELEDRARIEFVDSVQPPVPRDKKWVLIVSTLKGCPVNCPICDAGGSYGGKLSREEILAQVDHMVRMEYPSGFVPVPKLKIQFARMGDPAFNEAVIGALEELPIRYDMPGLMPCISTVAPRGCDRFFEKLLSVKRRLYGDGRFQMQFSIHSTDFEARRSLVPVQTWSFEQMADFGRRFFEPRDRKVTLNLAAVRGFPLEPSALRRTFDPQVFAVKLTPVNPTFASRHNGLVGLIDPNDAAGARRICAEFEAAGYETILSIGEVEENAIGSNCGMYVERLARQGEQGP